MPIPLDLAAPVGRGRGGVAREEGGRVEGVAGEALLLEDAVAVLQPRPDKVRYCTKQERNMCFCNYIHEWRKSSHFSRRWPPAWMMARSRRKCEGLRRAPPTSPRTQPPPWATEAGPTGPGPQTGLGGKQLNREREGEIVTS